MQDNISLLPLVKSCNTLPDDLFEELSDLHLLEFLDFQDLFDLESIQELNAMQTGLPLQIKGKSRNILEYVSTYNYNSSTPTFHNIKNKIKVKFGFASFS